jgi:hypothetical protein
MCGAGLVPREAYAGDDACVEPRVHDQTIADNLAAPSHTNANGLCARGYVWREANPDDHTCVTPQTRAQTRSDNQRACPDGHCSAVVIPKVVPIVRPGIPQRDSIRRWPSQKTTAVHTTRPVFRPERLHRGSTIRSTRASVSKPVFRGGNRKR